MVWLSLLRRVFPTPERVLGWLIAITGVILLIYLGLFARSMYAHFGWKQLRLLLFLWQAQSGAILAILAAGIGACAILVQTREGRRQAEEQRLRRLAGQRAVLPLALAALGDYADQCAAIVGDLMQQRSNASRTTLENVNFPPLPPDLVENFRQIIEASREAEARPLIILIRRVQIQHSRVGQIQRNGRSLLTLVRPGLEHRMIDAAEIYARCASLFDYARGADLKQMPQITPNDVKTALRVMRTGLLDMDQIEADIDRRAEHGENDRLWPEV
jgi:hypothetical protein